MRSQDKDVKGLGRVIRGQVSLSGGIVGGSGFSVSKTGTGIYVVTFLQAFSAQPRVEITGLQGNGVISNLNAPSTTTAFSFEVLSWTTSSGVLADGAFGFTATEMVPA